MSIIYYIMDLLEDVNNDGSWQELNELKNFKKIKGHPVVVVAPKNFKEIIIPLFCPLCKFPMKTREDSESFRAFSTCSYCSMYWGNKVLDYNNFDFDSEEWNDYISKKLLSSKPIINIK